MPNKIKQSKILLRKNPVIVIVGPTAVGKTELSIKLAKKFNGEIVNADSRQVYKGLNIGTGKVTKKEMSGIPHHLLDIASPKRKFSAAQYQKKALQVIKQIIKRGKIPFLVGGTGFYIQTVVDNLTLPSVKPDFKLRQRLEKETPEKLFQKLKKLDPKRAKNIDFHNKRRLIRALEIVIKSNRPVPQIKKASLFNTLIIGLTKSKKELKKRIRQRLLKRLRQGLIAEVKKLQKTTLSWQRLDDLGLEYRYVSRYLRGLLNKKEMIEKLLTEIEHYAKRQMTWFKKDKRIHWTKNYQEAEKLIKDFLLDK